jgi:diguanylate cyclase (GGDEF)-like protein
MERLEQSQHEFPFLKSTSTLYYAHKLHPLAIVSEFFAIIFCYLLFGKSYFIWVIISSLLITIRTVLYLTAVYFPKTVRLSFICSQFCSIFIWTYFGIISAQFDRTHVLMASLVITGLVSGATIFIIFIKFLYIFYSSITLGVFSLLLLSRGGFYNYIGIGIIILIIYLIHLSLKYHYFIMKYLSNASTYSQLYQEELMKIDTINKTQRKIQSSIQNRIAIEKNIISSNDKLEDFICHSVKFKSEIEKNIQIISDTITDCIIIIDKRLKIIHSNVAFNELFHLTTSENSDINSVISHIKKLLHNNDIFFSIFPFTSELSHQEKSFTLKTRDDHYISCMLKYRYTNDDFQNLWLFKDITDTITANAETLQLAHYDSLTGLPSRTLIYKKINELIDIAKKKSSLLAFVFIDIDDFKLYNDTMGHEYGNKILIKLSNLLVDFIPAAGLVGRLGGDEFLCILKDINYKSDIDPIFYRLSRELQKPLIIDDRSIILSVSIGISFYPCDSENPNHLFNYADMAMYYVKETGKSSYCRFLPLHKKKFEERHNIIHNLKNALLNNEFYLLYQPIYDFKKQELNKVEVLLRWSRNVPPNVFIPLAEKIGVLHDIEKWVIFESMKSCATVNSSSSSDIKFAINISHEQIITKSHIHFILDLIKSSGISPHLIEFELIESSLLNHSLAKYFIENANALGTTIAIDDFGTGFSSLSYLKELNFDTIKLDRSFISNIFANSKETKIIKAIIDLSKSLGSQVSIEGIETKNQFDYCANYLCNFGQGYYISKPCSTDILIEKISFQKKLSNL